MTHAVRIPGSVREKCHSSEKLLVGSSTEGLARAKKKTRFEGKNVHQEYVSIEGENISGDPVIVIVPLEKCEDFFKNVIS